MAATTTTTSAAAAAAATSFYTTLNYKSWPINDHHQIFRISFNKKVCHQSPTLLSHSYGTFNELNFISKRNVSRIAAAVEAVEDAAEAETVVEPEEESGSGANTKLYFGNLPYLCDSAQLAGIIQEYASPELVEVLYDRNTGKSRGFAFVTMSSVEDCKNVIENLDGSQYGGRTLRVNFSDKPKPKEPLYPETEYKLFVGNLSWSVTSEILTEAFGAHGNVVGARVLYDGETGRSRGYGFVCYETRDEMETAIQALNEVELEGRTLRVSLAEGKKQ